MLRSVWGPDRCFHEYRWDQPEVQKAAENMHVLVHGRRCPANDEVTKLVKKVNI